MADEPKKIDAYNLGSLHVEVWPMEDREDKYLIICNDGEDELKLAVGIEEFTNYRKLTNRSIQQAFRNHKDGGE